MSSEVARAIELLRGYCGPYEQGGGGSSDLTAAVKTVLRKIEELQTIVGALLKTKDGVPVVDGMVVWERSPWGDLRSLPVRTECFHDVTKCYSRKEAVPAAKEKK